MVDKLLKILRLREFSKTGKWILILILILIGLNLMIFVIYQGAHPTEDFWVQSWKYFDSNIFKIVTVSLVFPILLLILESRFKIVEAVRKNRLEQVRVEEDERRAKRIEIITKTIQIWNQLFNLTTEVIHFKEDVDKEERIQDLLKKLGSFQSSANDVVTMWFTGLNLPEEKEFYDLYDRAQEVFLLFINWKLLSDISVVYYIRENHNKKEWMDLQSCLLIIQGMMENKVYSRIILILKLFVKLAKLYEDKESDDKMNQVQYYVEMHLIPLENWTKKLKKLEMKHNKFLQPIVTKEVVAFRDVAEWIIEWKRKNYNKSLIECKKYKKLLKLFSKIPHEKIIHSVHIPYSKEFIRNLADYMYLRSVLDCLEEDAKWPK